uniref:PEP152R n=1 Tax=African swine fever virus TaxID=10497 RepID=A0A6G7KTT4_ASF
MFITRRNNILHAFFLQSLIILYDKSNNVLYMWFIILGAAICTPFSLHAWSYYFVYLYMSVIVPIMHENIYKECGMEIRFFYNSRDYNPFISIYNLSIHVFLPLCIQMVQSCWKPKYLVRYQIQYICFLYLFLYFMLYWKTYIPTSLCSLSFCYTAQKVYLFYKTITLFMLYCIWTTSPPHYEKLSKNIYHTI